MQTTRHVTERYSAGAKEKQSSLCCPVDYDSALLRVLPQEIIDKDYGCGDPSRYVRPGDTVLDLGSGGGKICYMAAQLTGPAGKVIGVDMNDDMLALARKYQVEMAGKLGGERVVFLKGYIQDLAMDIAAHENYLNEHPVTDLRGLQQLQDFQAGQKLRAPLIADASVDLVISNCVLNLVGDHEKEQMIREIFRVLKPGGRIAISDIVSDEVVPHELKNDPQLWSGCVSGAFEEHAFLSAFAAAGFQAIKLDKWEAQPWRVVQGIEFRSVTLTAIKGETSPCLDYGHAVLYRGPFSQVRDDDGHVYFRGERMAVCERTYHMLMNSPYQNDFIGIAPAELGEPTPWCAPPGTRRPSRSGRGGQHRSDCGPTCC